jgi:hypothetical protein
MPILTVLTNEQGDVVGTARTQMGGRGSGLPGRTSVVARPGQMVIEIEVGDDVLNLDPSALHEFIRTNHLRRAEALETPPSTSTSENDDGGAHAPDEKPLSPSKDRDLVTTPGGPRPRENVHHVDPGEAVKRNAKGNYTVVPKDPGVKSKKR